MSQHSSLELQGDLKSLPLAELLAEIARAELSGSLRLSLADRKAIVYFEEGKTAFVVSNERRFRLAESLAHSNIIDRFAGQSPHPAQSDAQLAEQLVASGTLSREQADEMLREQARMIILSALAWDGGEWSFSRFARLREGGFIGVDTSNLLVSYARSLSPDRVAGRFRNLNERFSASLGENCDINLRPQEAFVYSRFESEPLRLCDVIAASGLQEHDAMQALYSLWLGGLVSRQDRHPALSDEKIAAIKSAELGRKKELQSRPVSVAPPKPAEASRELGKTVSPESPSEAVITVDEYLNRVEKAESLYEILSVSRSAKAADIRSSYFALAKEFHPDRYHKADRELRQRVENAFTRLAHSYETLRDDASRAAYDKKLEQHLKDQELIRDAGTAAEEAQRPAQEAQASAEFERGFSLHLRGEMESALPFLARAVYYSPRNARYRAFYGKVLSYDEKHKHKAEHELQTAIKLEPEDPSYRIMLAEFFVRMKLLKRAEGELGRLLVKFPGNSEAKTLLDSLRSK